MDKTQIQVQQYYGETLQVSADLQTSACCDSSTTPDWLKMAMGNIHEEVLAKYYGCGLVAPEQLKGMKILDLGSGSGRDCYLLAQLVGEEGFVLGVDMTDEQLDVANAHLDYHREKFGYAQSNVVFKKGMIEKLDALGLEDNFFDIVISNCVINLSTDKEAVLREVKRVLKPGGEMYFSDVYANRRVPAELVKDPVLYGECLSGALYWNDFINLAKTTGFADPRLTEAHLIEMGNAKIEAKTEGIDFYSATYRLFNIENLEPACEDYGQAVRYLGTIDHAQHAFALDLGHTFETGKIESVCGNTLLMLQTSRFAKHFDFFGDFSKHYGIFTGCGEVPFSTENTSSETENGGCC